MKKKINRYGITEAQRQAIAAGIVALGEVVQAHKAANPEHSSFEIGLNVKHERPLLEDWNSPAKTSAFFNVGTYFEGNGCGKTIDAALADMFGKTDVTEKLAHAKRCREAADKFEKEAAELAAEQAAAAR
jgi:hypothetical protein